LEALEGTGYIKSCVVMQPKNTHHRGARATKEGEKKEIKKEVKKEDWVVHVHLSNTRGRRLMNTYGQKTVT